MNLKKPKFWDAKNPNIYAYLLLPLSFLIRLFASFKEKKVNKKIKIKTICVGNIYVGGTGKTSLSIKINEILSKKNFKSCFVKKFYKNQLDEQKVLENNGKLFLSRKRMDALITAENENYKIAILDDGLQDKSIKYDISFVCFNNINWIGNGMTIPSGPLREPLNTLKKYKNVFINGNCENIEILKKEILQINSEINIHIGKYEPKNLDEFEKNDKFVVFSGIGNHQTFISMLKKYGLNILKEFEFPDHYKYTKKDIDEILLEANKLKCKILTTEKDYLRLNIENLSQIKFIKSELKIIDEEKFLKSLL
mgnify:FL=1